MAKATGYEDIYSAAQFGSLTEVVAHASSPTQDREKLYGQASKAMIKDGRWRGYIMQYSPRLHLHVGYRFANPKHWFLKASTGFIVVEGPFRSKKSILSRLRVKTSTQVSAGVYSAQGYTIFTRDHAADVGVDEETLP